MRAIIVSPTKAHLVDMTAEDIECKTELQYVDSTVAGKLMGVRRNKDWKTTNPRSWAARLRELAAEQTVNLYSVVSRDPLCIECFPASLHALPLESVENRVAYPPLDPRYFQLTKPFPFELYKYQVESVAALLEAKFANVSMATGTGKQMIAINLVLEAGIAPCAVVVPGRENFRSLGREFAAYFGEARVGMFGDGKKQIGRDITICIGKSLSVMKDEAHIAHFRAVKLMVVDESHTWGSRSMSAVCNGIFADVPYRFFLSATQVRSADEENLLRSIIGPCVYSLTTSDSISADYINDHSFEIHGSIPAPAELPADALGMRRAAFLYNPAIVKIIAERCAKDTAAGKPSLVLVSEVGQIGLLVKALPSSIIDQVAFAHGETNKKRLEALGLPPNTAKSMTDAILDMNRGRKTLLLATGCIATGSSLYTVHTTYNFVGGGSSSKVATVQGSVGRSVRKWKSNPYVSEIPPTIVPKDKAVIVDFDVIEPQMQAHFKKRLSYYRESGTDIKFL
jgi:hypothetical protein